MRLDIYLSVFGLARSRTNASNLIKMGLVNVNDVPEFKTAREICASDSVSVATSNNFASLGGIKLQKALEYFSINVENKIAIDIGASNGGFTDVLLKAGIAKVYAVDVSKCALPPEIKNDSRVFVKDSLNARYIEFEDIGIKADIVTVDVSFISLKLILPVLLQFLKHDSIIITLIKPQFEVGRKNLNKHGMVTNSAIAEKAVSDIISFGSSLGLLACGNIPAPHPFADKNKEYLALFRACINLN
ncbi:MAG: TlyA family RNA methyltransferase [Christensenellaceae bacterium]|jgi:23S rRNA (cytidine1920-2'-O)/16S rRNA (cytidine1409-2'-O)-methyltransferase|nr:TlyA family RNA methyltransferase [Christensenellaceae bacterium]